MVQARQEALAEREGREAATAAVMKLQTVIESVQQDMTEQQEAYSRRAQHSTSSLGLI